MILPRSLIIRSRVWQSTDFLKNQVQNDLGGILIKNWRVFLPATAINLAFCPPELPVLFLNCVFFGWVVYLSLFLNKEEEAA